jgi:hypothetical protein
VSDQLNPLREFAVRILRAYQPGDVVILRYTRAVSANDHARIAAALESFKQSSGINFVVLDDSLEVVTKEEQPLLTHPFGNGHRATIDKAIEWAYKYGGDGDLADLREIKEFLGPVKTAAV